MAVFGVPVPVVSALISVFAGAAVYHLVAITLTKQRLERAVLVELRRNYCTLQGDEAIVTDPKWQQELHNDYQTQAFDALLDTAPSIWVELEASSELVDLYDRLTYLNDLKAASLINQRPLERSEVLPIIRDSQSDIELLFRRLRQEWWCAGHDLDLSCP